ncbi:MAG TPA: hypothetical protein DCZ48_13945, partial [Methylococcaceae bacterium]|nr:hypothetical protein [Methylococcaceae bacterium]
GIFGLFLNLLIIFYIFNIILKSINIADKQTRSLLGGFIFGYTGLLISIFFVNLFNPWFFIWAYIALMTRLAILVKYKNTKPEKIRFFKETPLSHSRP